MKKRQIFIELTSLLDVILIMLFMVMVRAEGKTTEAMDNAKQNEAALETLSGEYAALESAYAEKASEAEGLKEALDEANSLLLSRDLVAENSDILTVFVREDRLIVVRAEGRQNQAISYDWEEPAYAYNKLKAALKDWTDRAGDKSLFFVFQYDREQIYYNEYEMIRNTVQELKNDLKKENRSFNYIEMDVRPGV
ncbi:MAG: hypothetical protein J6Z38_03030 [Lachnospiraceae bacterium]|nr:hypothetical protein [Lachnospiraceae bacterium]